MRKSSRKLPISCQATNDPVNNRSLNHAPPRTSALWNRSEWRELAEAFAPEAAGAEEKQLLGELLLSSDERQLGALPDLWRLQENYESDALQEEALHTDLEQHAPAYGALVEAIRTYEAFARGLQDGFDALRAEAAGPDARGYVVPRIARNEDFRRSVRGLDERFSAAHRALGEITPTTISLQNLFDERFRKLAEPMDAQACAVALCEHHEAVQQAKSAEGKRPGSIASAPIASTSVRRIASRNARLPPNDTYTAIAAGQSTGFGPT